MIYFLRSLIKKLGIKLTLTLPALALALPSGIFAQIAPADIGVLYGSTGNQDGGRIITINKENAQGTEVSVEGLGYGVPGLAINSAGEIFAVSSNNELYRVGIDSTDFTYINQVNIYFLPAIAFNHMDELFGLALFMEEYYQGDDVQGKTSGKGPGFFFGEWQLIKIDTSNADWETIVKVPYEEWRGMSFDPADGNIYASTADGEIHMINPINGESSELSTINVGDGVPDLAFDNDGNLFASFVTYDTGYGLAAIDKWTGSADSIGNIGFGQVSGMDSRTLPLTGPQIGVFPVLDFNERGVNTQSIKHLTVWNVGTENVSISNITMPLPADQFYMESVSFPLIIEPGNYAEIDINFWPSAEGEYESDITISSNDPDNPSNMVYLSGDAIEIPVGSLFASDPRTGAFWVIDPLTGENDSLGVIEIGEEFLSGITEIEFRSDATIFATFGGGVSSMISINPLGGDFEFVGRHEFGAINGLDFSPGGTLFGTHIPGPQDPSILVIVDQDSATIDTVGFTGYSNIRGLSFSDAGILYGVGPDTANGDTTDILMMIDTATGIATKVGATGFIRIGALEFGPDGVLYGGLSADIDSALDGGLISIDPVTGEGTFLGLTGAQALSGLSFFPQIEVIINSVSAKNAKKPKGFSLAQNYPNPFNPTTRINFKIDNPGFVTLKVFNIAGQLVETLVSEKFEQGSHTYNWNASNLASGLYFYKLENGSHTLVKKAILIK